MFEQAWITANNTKLEPWHSREVVRNLYGLMVMSGCTSLLTVGAHDLGTISVLVDALFHNAVRTKVTVIDVFGEERVATWCNRHDVGYVHSDPFNVELGLLADATKAGGGYDVVYLDHGRVEDSNRRLATYHSVASKMIAMSREGYDKTWREIRNLAPVVEFSGKRGGVGVIDPRWLYQWARESAA